MSDPRRNFTVAHGSILVQAVSVTSVATALPTTALANRSSIIICNNAALGGQTIYVGGSDVTSAAGIPIYPQSSIAFDVGNELALYAITAAATADVRIMEAR